MSEITLISFLPADGNAAPVFDSLHNFLLKGSADISVILAGTADAIAKAEEAAKKSKSFGQWLQNGKVVYHQCDSNGLLGLLPKENNGITIIAKPEYIKNISELISWQKQNPVDPSTVYAVSGKEKSGFWRYAKIRAFNSADIKGMENGFIFFSNALSDSFSSLKNINEKNFSLRIASYAKLAGLNLEEVKLNLNPIPQKISWWASLKNAAANRWQWMAKEPLKAMKTGQAKPGQMLSEANHPGWRLVFFALAAICIILYPLLSFHFGISWDEKGDFDYAKAVYNYYTTFGKDKTLFNEKANHLFGPLSFYGMLVNLVCVVTYKILPILGEFETKHLILSLIGAVGILYAGRIAKMLGSWQAGVLVLLLMLVSPIYMGHQMNNAKDGPFAVAYIMALYYVICFLRELPNPKTKTMVLLTLSATLAMSTRIGGLLIFAYLGLFMAIHWLAEGRREGFPAVSKRIGPYAKYYFGMLAAAYIITVIFWPFALQNPIKNPWIALTEFTNFKYIYNYELFEGKLLHIADKPWYYLPKFILIQTPLIIVAGALLSLILAAFNARKNNLYYFLILLFAAAFPVCYAIYKHSSLYNAWRQFLFVYPPIVVAAGLGWQWLINTVKIAAAKTAVLLVVIAGVGYTAAWMVRNFPYEYIYYNEIVGGTKGAYSNYELDYYSISLKEAAEWLDENEGTVKSFTIVTNNEPYCAGYYVKKENPAATVKWSGDINIYRYWWDYALLASRTLSHTQMNNGSYPPKGTIHEIRVDGVPILAIVKRENNYIPESHRTFEQNKYDSSAYYARKAIEYDPNNVEAYRLLSAAAINMKDSTTAFWSARKNIELYPEDYMAMENMGQAMFITGRYDSAIAYFEKSVGFKKNYTSAYMNRGIVELKLERYRDVLKSFDLAIEYGGERPEFHMYKSKAYQYLKETDAAINELGKALQLNPRYADAYYQLAFLHSQKGDNAMAEKMFMRYKELTGK